MDCCLAGCKRKYRRGHSADSPHLIYSLLVNRSPSQMSVLHAESVVERQQLIKPFILNVNIYLKNIIIFYCRVAINAGKLFF